VIQENTGVLALSMDVTIGLLLVEFGSRFSQSMVVYYLVSHIID
jgi:hypothetical protein